MPTYDKTTTTTTDRFPVVDISHKPKRMQGDAIRAQYPDTEEVEDITFSRVPKNVTMEKAIHFYEENATGECASLYKQTAIWLRELLVSRKIVYAPTSDEASTCAEETHADGVDAYKAKELLDKVRGNSV